MGGAGDGEVRWKRVVEKRVERGELENWRSRLRHDAADKFRITQNAGSRSRVLSPDVDGTEATASPGVRGRGDGTGGRSRIRESGSRVQKARTRSGPAVRQFSVLNAIAIAQEDDGYDGPKEQKGSDFVRRGKTTRPYGIRSPRERRSTREATPRRRRSEERKTGKLEDWKTERCRRVRAKAEKAAQCATTPHRQWVLKGVHANRIMRRGLGDGRKDE
ncbi:hypothetical protein PLEOSDRAFT_168790 [Pleurotus ostreatus PC15]|uniref:Uncharacterized protein n=1 Tax=Pleurotus ostreatus (strain PC15) TaxID=1137138 RepID=A0A067NTI6_PLEO1|nr:hypothetical protein PLEOSDRAFT_168790 [Pleurotus ostreatus PC15]